MNDVVALSGPSATPAPLVACGPDQPPEAVQDEALVEVHERWMLCPGEIEALSAARLAVAAGIAVTSIP